MSRRASEMARKVVHMGMGACALLLRFLTPLQAAGCAAAAILFNWFALHRLTGGKLLRPNERGRSFSSGIVLYPTAVLALLLFFHARPDLAAAAWGLLAFGDGMATVAGVLLGGPRLPWNRDKTWSGFAAFLVFGATASVLLLVWTRWGREETGSLLVLGCVAAALAAGFVESLETGIDDNIGVPAVAAAILFATSLVDPRLLRASAATIGQDALRGLAVNGLLAVGAYLARGVSVSGALLGTVLGTLLYAFGGAPAFLLLFLFFVLATAATRVGWRRKESLGIAQERGGRRGAKHAFANACAGVVFAFLAVATPYHAAFALAVVAAFATATADTVSSEIGQAYGRRTYLVTTLRPVPPGTDGAVSLEGTLAGVLASLVVAWAAYGLGLASAAGVPIVVIAAFAGTTLESYAGALLGETRRVDNEVVNFGNTVAGGLCAILLHRLFGS